MSVLDWKWSAMKWDFKIPSLTSTRRKRMSPTKARRTIAKTLVRSKFFLSHICLDSGDCLSFGKRSVEMNKLFEFNTFKYISNITPVSSGRNGGAIALKYRLKQDHRNYSAYAILKSAFHEMSDNLMYEYMVGVHFINLVSLRFPTFLSTYGIYTRPHPITKKEHLKELVLQRDNYKVACTQGEMLSILIQHIRGTTLTKCLEDARFVLVDLTNILFILYHTLSSLAKQFTHYDLHTDNVMIIELSGPIEYVYTDEHGHVLTFRSVYLPKIIDYGRSFFDNGTFSSKDIYDHICNTPECTRDTDKCGETLGLAHLNDASYYHTFTKSIVKNESHDLRLLRNLHPIIEKFDTMSEGLDMTGLFHVLRHVQYGKGIDSVADEPYGTIENLTHQPPHIYTVHDAKERLQSLVIPNQTIYPDIIGRLLISKDRMVFEPIKS